jgi:hypothetical protein
MQRLVFEAVGIGGRRNGRIAVLRDDLGDAADVFHSLSDESPCETYTQRFGYWAGRSTTEAASKASKRCIYRLQ